MYYNLPIEIQKYIMTFHSNTPFQKQEFIEKMKSRPKYMYDLKDGALHSFSNQYDESFITDKFNNGLYDNYIRYTIQDIYNDGAWIDNVNEISITYIPKWNSLNIFEFFDRKSCISYIKERILRKDYNSIRKKLNILNTIDRFQFDDIQNLLQYYTMNYY